MIILKELQNSNYSLNNLSLDRGYIGLMELKRPDYMKLLNRNNQNNENIKNQNILLFQKLNIETDKSPRGNKKKDRKSREKNMKEKSDSLLKPIQK